MALGESENDVKGWIQAIEAAKLYLSESEHPLPPSPIKGEMPETDVDNDDDGELLYILESRFTTDESHKQQEIPLLVSNVDREYIHFHF